MNENAHMVHKILLKQQAMHQSTHTHTPYALTVHTLSNDKLTRAAGISQWSVQLRNRASSFFLS